jgi:hypothetical protein
LSVDPFYKGPKEPRPKRSLEEVPAAERQEQIAAIQKVTPEDVKGIFDGFAFQINRATALIRSLEPIVSKMSIPVDRNAVAVQNAVRRRLQGTDGMSIPFSLYKDLIDYRLKTARKITHEIAGELTGNTLADANVIRRYMKNGGKGLSPWQDFILQMEPFLLWMIFSQLQGQFSCVEHQECTAAKEPPGTEIGPIQLRNAISIAAMMLVLGLQEQHVLYAVQQPADSLGVPPVDIINRARKLIQTDLHREVNEIVGAADPELIISYCDEYIARHPEGYIEWLAYRDVLHTRERATVVYLRSHQYSKEYSTLLDYSSESVFTSPLPSPRVPVQTMTLPLGVTGTLMSTEHFFAFLNELKGVDRTLSSIAGVSTVHFAEDVLCCIGRFLGKEDAARLRRIAHVVRVARNVLTNGINVADPFSLLDFALDQIQHQVLAHITYYFDRFARDVLAWVGETSDVDWDLLFACPLIEDLLSNALSAVAMVRDRITQELQQFMSRTFNFHDRIYVRWGSLLDLRRVDTLLSIIEGVLSAVERCAPYGAPGDDAQEPPPNPGENPEVWSGVPRPLILPPEVVEKFFNNPNPVRREPGQKPIPPVGTKITTSNVEASGKNFREICRGILPDELIQSVQARSNA